MTDNTNIEAEKKLFKEAIEKYAPYRISDFSTTPEPFEVWMLCRRAALSNAEPVVRVSGYFGGQCVVVPVNPAVVLPVNAALFLHPSVPAPTDKNEKRLRYIYQQTMKRLVKPCMTYEEYIAALDFDICLPLTNTGEQE